MRRGKGGNFVAGERESGRVVLVGGGVCSLTPISLLLPRSEGSSWAAKMQRRAGCIALTMKTRISGLSREEREGESRIDAFSTAEEEEEKQMHFVPQLCRRKSLIFCYFTLSSFCLLSQDASDPWWRSPCGGTSPLSTSWQTPVS